MILQIDMGNTRIKWRVKTRLASLGSGSLPANANWSELNSALEAHIDQLRSVQVVSVQSAERNLSFADWMDDSWNIRPKFARSEPGFGVVLNGYERPETLGSDRWCGIIAGYSLCRSACVIVSAGTAITVDLLTSNGRHCGGYIALGAGAYREAINRVAALVQVNGKYGGDILPGVNTESAVLNAYSLMIRELIEKSINVLKDGQPDVQVGLVVTGGDAVIIKDLFPSAILEPELIFNGLTLLFDADDTDR